jgi:hypothetical protein
MNICILGLKRSGSTYLSCTLMQNDWVRNVINEPFQDRLFQKDKTPCDKIITSIRNESNQGGVILKEIHFYEPLVQRHIKFYKQVLKENFYVIKLVRENTFDRTLSALIAHKTGVWNAYSEDACPAEQFSISPSLFLKTYKEEQSRSQMLKDFDVFDDIVTYKELNTLKRDYMPKEVDKTLLPVKLVKKKQLITNYKELKTMIK